MEALDTAVLAKYRELLERARDLLDRTTQLSEVTAQQLDAHRQEPWAEILAPHHFELFYDADTLTYQINDLLQLPINTEFQLPLDGVEPHA